MSPKEESKSRGVKQEQSRGLKYNECHWSGEDAGDSIFTQRESRDDYTV